MYDSYRLHEITADSQTSQRGGLRILSFSSFPSLGCTPKGQEGVNGDTFSIKAPKEYSKKFAAIFKGIFLTRGNVLRIFFWFVEDFGAPL